MRNALVFVGIGAIILAGGSWYLAHMNTGTATSSPAPTPATKQQTAPAENQPSTENQGAAIGSESTVTFKCDNNKRITAVFERDIVGLTLSDGRQFTLRQSISGSGIRYLSNDTKIEFDGKGNEGFLLESDKTTYANCVASAL